MKLIVRESTSTLARCLVFAPLLEITNYLFLTRYAPMTPTNWQKKSDQDFHITDFTDTLIRQAEQGQQTLRKPTSKFSKDIQYPINRGRLIHPSKTALIMFSAFYAMVKKKLVFLFIRVARMLSNLWNFNLIQNQANQKKQD